MANKHMERCSVSYVIKELQTKTAMRYYYTLIRMAKNYGDNKKDARVSGGGRKG